MYMLLSYVPGGELFSHLRRAGRFTADVTRFYLSSIILAIACECLRPPIERPQHALKADIGDPSSQISIAKTSSTEISSPKIFS